MSSTTGVKVFFVPHSGLECVRVRLTLHLFVDYCKPYDSEVFTKDIFKSVVVQGALKIVRVSSTRVSQRCGADNTLKIVNVGIMSDGSITHPEKHLNRLPPAVSENVGVPVSHVGRVL